MNDLEYCKLYNKIKYGTPIFRTRIFKGATGPTGATGATGATGRSEVIEVGRVESVVADAGAKVFDRYEQNKHYIDFQIPIGHTGATGERGQPGEKGATGDVGPKGEKGDKGDQGPRGFPGEIGISEVITIDGTQTVPYGEEALVQDDFDRNIHHLTFYIPQGKTGERGEKGEAGDVGPKGDQGQIGPRGEQGPTGKTGVAGPPGATPNINITRFNSSSQEIRSRIPIVINETLVNNSMTFDANSIIVPSNGVYLISFSINNGSYATSGDCIGVAVNLNLVDASRRPLTASTNTSCTFVQRLSKGDYVCLIPTLSNSTTLLASGAPSAMLTVMLIAF